MTQQLRSRRSNLAVPGSNPKMLDKARGLAEDASAKRQKAERDAITRAQQTRQKERQLENVEQARNRTLDLISDAKTPPATPLTAEQLDERNSSVKQLEALARNYRAGQTPKTVVVDYLTEGTIDARALNALENKTDLLNEIMTTGAL